MNLALDEALLDYAEQSNSVDSEVLRIWESPSPIVVCGRSSRVEEEVFREVCHGDGVPVLRRCSGGATIVAGPGCLMYSLVISHERRPGLQMIEQAHQFVLGALVDSLRHHGHEVTLAGISDLVMGPEPRKKCSGNSLRLRRTHLLYHGTLLYDFHLEWISRYLAAPPREPDYRGRRDHASFVANLPITQDEMRAAVLDAWPTTGARTSWPEDLTQQLVMQRYTQDAWNLAR